MRLTCRVHGSSLIPAAAAIAFFGLTPSISFAEESPGLRGDGAVALYGDGKSTAMLETATLQRNADKLRLGVSRRQPFPGGKPGTGPASPLAGTETGATVSGQVPSMPEDWGFSSIEIAPRAGYLTSEIDDSKSTSMWFGAGISTWTGEQTIRWTLDLQRNLTHATALDVTDVDGKRILTPERIGGTSAGLTWTHLASPGFLWRGGVSVILRDDRPEAHTASLEGRYFVSATNSSIHASVARFENRGHVEPVTLTGSIEATTVTVEWHQKTGERTILAPGYRWYRETETPRASNGVTKTLGTDQVYATLRYRFWKDYWLEDSPEAFLTAGSYQTNTGLRIWQLAIGGSLFIIR